MNTKETIKLEQELASYNGPDKIISFADMQKEVSEHAPPLLSVKSDIPSLDKYVQGFESGELIVVSGRPKSGKSLILQSFTKNFQDNSQLPTCWFSYELPPRQFLSRFPELPKLGYMPKRMQLGNIWWLEKKIMEAKLKYGVSIFMIDHLHYLFDMSKTSNVSLEIGSVLRKLVAIAIQHNIIIFLVCHIGKIVSDKEPEAEDIRDSSFVLQEPATVLLLWREADDEKKKPPIKNRSWLKVAMTRRTGVFNKKFPLVMIGGYLYEEGS